jgi:hypothetical protein
MRASFVVLLAMVALASSVAIADAGDQLDLPLRKAGLWDVRTQTDEGQGVKEQRLKLCIGEQMERDTVRVSGEQNRINCPKYVVNKSAVGTIVDASCVYDDRKVITHTELSGDFKTTFKVKVESSVAGNAPKAQGGAPVDVTRTILQDGTYVGTDCGSLSAGDAQTVDGQTVTVQ